MLPIHTIITVQILSTQSLLSTHYHKCNTSVQVFYIVHVHFLFEWDHVRDVLVTCDYLGHVWLSWSRVIILVTCDYLGHVWLSWSRVIILVTCDCLGHVWLSWSRVIILVTCDYFGHVWLSWSRVIILVTCDYLGHVWLFWSRVIILVTCDYLLTCDYLGHVWDSVTCFQIAWLNKRLFNVSDWQSRQ